MYERAGFLLLVLSEATASNGSRNFVRDRYGRVLLAAML